jgi:hypothetical protein
MRVVGVAGLGAFLLIVVALHALEPSLSPDTHVLSEFANTRVGWLFRVALSCWVIALVATAAWFARERTNLGAARNVVAALLIVAAGGLVAAAVFRTQAVSGLVRPGIGRTFAGRAHDAGAGISIIALFAAAATVGFAAGRGSVLGRLSLTVVGFALVVQVTLLAVGHEVGGIRQRLLVLAACVWQAAALGVPRTPRRS